MKLDTVPVSVWVNIGVCNQYTHAVTMACWKHSCLRVSKKAKLHGVKVGRGCVLDSDMCSWWCCLERGGWRRIQPWNESEIMILASLQFRYTITSAYMCSASVCVLTGIATALKVQGEMAIPSCQPDLQVSCCTSAWPAVKLGANKVLFKNKG